MRVFVFLLGRRGLVSWGWAGLFCLVGVAGRMWCVQGRAESVAEVVFGRFWVETCGGVSAEMLLCFANRSWG